MIKIKNLTKKFDQRIIYENLSINFPNNGIVGVLGDSGSGKTTLLNMISGIDNDYSGDIMIDHLNLKKIPSNKRGSFRIKNIGFVFQNFNLLNLDNVQQNVRLPLESISNKSIPRLNKRVDDVLSIVGLKNKAHEKVQNLSGGQKQRAAIARAIINNPKIILCDEPTGALDEQNGIEIMDLLHKISRSSLVLISSHDEELIKKYASTILHLKNGNIVTSTNKLTIINNKKYLIRDIGKTNEHPTLSLSFKFRHSLQQMKAKKYRSLVTNLMISLSLTSIGLSLILSNSLSSKLDSAFSSLFTTSQIVMSPKNPNPNIFDGIYSASFNQVENIFNRYSYYLDGIGCTYMVNFEDFFKDENEIYISSTPYKIPLNGLSARSINDFRYINETAFDKTYPSINSVNNDEIILGLKYEDMANICYQLHIQRNYFTLGQYIKNVGLFVTLSVANFTWSYSDEQLFRVRGVVQTSSNTIYHTNRTWNEYVFEEQMRFPSGDGTSQSLPWVMYKLYYLMSKDDPHSFLDVALYDEFLFDYVFERTNYSYHPKLCKPNEVCKENRLLVYYVDKTSIHMSDVSNIIRYFPELSNYYISSNFGYISYGSSLMSGFAKNVFLSSDSDLLDQAMDADSSMHLESSETLDLPKGIIQGNFTNSVSGGLQFSSCYKDILCGNKPTSCAEIAISKGLVKYLNLPDNPLNMRLFFASVSNEYIEKDLIYKEYAKTEVKVTAIVDEEQNVIYHSPNWSISFFRDELGISSFNLTPISVVFELNDKNKTQSLIKKLESTFTDYDFVNPISEAIESVNSTTDYLEKILFIFSLVTTVIAIILLSLTILINITENQNEIDLFSLIGFTSFDVYSTFICHSLLQGFISFLMSSFELLAIDFLLNKVIGNMLGSKVTFTFNFKAVLIELCLMILIVTITGTIVTASLLLKRKNAKKE